MKKVAEGIWKITYETPEQFTPVSMREHKIAEEELERMGREEGKEPAVLPLSENDISFAKSARGITVTLPMKTDEDIFGFGLQLLSLNAAGRRRYIKVNSDPKMDTGESHAPVPFYISTAGYGLFVDTYRYTSFYMGTNTERGISSGKKEVNMPHKEFSESALYAFKRAKEERKVIIEIPAAEGIELYLFAGNVKEVVRRYNLFSGGGCLPPMWGLGMWYRVYGGSDENHVKRLADEFREDRLPVDVIGLEPGWHSHSYSCTYEWSYLFPNHQRMTEELKDEGYHINLWEHIFVYPAAPFYEDLLPNSGDYEVWNGLVPDFATEKAKNVFGEWHEEQFIKKGITGFKLDECDNSDFNPSNWSFPDSTVFPSGMDGEQMHSAVGMLYQNLIFQSFKNQDVRTLSQVRSSGALAAPLPFVLYSDLYGHKEFIRGMVTSSFSGLLWAPEVRDCANGTDLLRRVETIVFSPQALLNCWRIPNPPWKQVNIEKNLDNELMEDREYYTDACRRLFELRMSLLPYLYSAFVEYHEKGIPPVRAMAIDVPEDIEARNIDDQYFFGKDLLVCPLTLEDGNERMVYLPAGRWHDFFRDRVYEGGQWMKVTAEADEIPVFVRDNSLVVLAKPVLFVGEKPVFEMEIRSYGEGEAEFTLYEDDFTSFQYEKQGIGRVVVRRDREGNLTVPGHKESSQYRFLNICS
ncbi:TIM-barrel domain-containing protein [Lacrimispora sp. JR3]|uniref:glycoside hydrolase family 31 protein n=1 Tax=Lacrimispora sinapis TaxID=3111456 RepID=UPI0037498AAE